MNDISHLPDYLQVHWPQPDGTVASVDSHHFQVHALTTLKTGGYSRGDFACFNLATHVADEEKAVQDNREQLCQQLALPSAPVWLEQVHSNKVYRAKAAFSNNPGSMIKADACTSDEPGIVCTVLTADCLPVFFCNRAMTEVAVAHAGWRGLHQGIIGNTVQAMHSSAEDILVSLGPAIGPAAFEVGDEVYAAFVKKNAVNKNAFVAGREQRYLCDIYQLARNELSMLGINNVSGGEYCTYSDTSRFYSYRRSARTGRMASLIWMQ